MGEGHNNPLLKHVLPELVSTAVCRTDFSVTGTQLAGTVADGAWQSRAWQRWGMHTLGTRVIESSGVLRRGQSAQEWVPAGTAGHGCLHGNSELWGPRTWPPCCSFSVRISRSPTTTKFSQEDASQPRASAHHHRGEGPSLMEQGRCFSKMFFMQTLEEKSQHEAVRPE